MRFSQKIPSIRVTVSEKDFHKGALEVLRAVRPRWPEDTIKSKVFTDGLSNKLVGFYAQDNPEEMVIVKIFGKKTGELVDRVAEIKTMRILHERQCGAELYATFNNGICYEYMNGSTLNVSQCSHPEIYPLVAKEMAKLHSSTGSGCTGSGKKSSMWKRMEKFNRLAEAGMAEDAGLRERLEAVGMEAGWGGKVMGELKRFFQFKHIPITFCHNDLLPNNIVYDPKRRRITFIDVEYAGPNYPAFDVANHFLEFAGVSELDYSKVPTREFRLRWIKEYISHLRLPASAGSVTVEEFNNWVELCIPASHLLWTLWAIHQARHSTIDYDYVHYAGNRLEEFKKSMEQLRQGEFK